MRLTSTTYKLMSNTVIIQIYTVLAIILMASFFSILAGQSVWTVEDGKSSKMLKKQTSSFMPELQNGSVYKQGYLDLKQAMEILVRDKNLKGTNSQFYLPDMDGSMILFDVKEASNMHPDLQARYPLIRSYVGTSINDPNITARFSLNHMGIDAYIRKAGDHTIRITHSDFSKNTEHLIYYQKDEKVEFKKHSCGAEVSKEKQRLNISKEFKGIYDCVVYTFDLAFAMTPTLSNTLTDVNMNGLVDEGMALINNKVTMMNDNFGRELSVKFQLVSNNDDLIFTDMASNPYTETGSNPTAEIIAENQSVIDDEIGEDNYDIGHVLWLGPPSGVIGRARLGTVCDDGDKARGVSNVSDATILHELGHQFDAEHTFGPGCDDDNINDDTAFEVGCGRTIMSYAGNPFLNFHGYSLAQMRGFISGLSGGCRANSQVVNDRPLIYPETTVYFPVGTPYILKTDAWNNDGDILSYMWDQVDAEEGFIPSVAPTPENERFVPSIPDLLSGDATIFNSQVPSSNKAVDIYATVRDNNPDGGCMDLKWRRMNFDTRGGPFLVTYAGPSAWVSGNNYNINWEVANTDESPFNVSEVEIWLAFDGLNFDHFIKSTPNDGSTTIFADPCFPNSSNIRVMVRAKDHFFYDINAYDISFTGSSLTVTSTSNSGYGSLRQAIICANIIGGKQTITIDPSVNGTLTLGSALPVIQEPVRIDGQFANLSIDVNGNEGGLNLQGSVFTGDSIGHEIYGLTLENFTGAGISIYCDNTIIGGDGIKNNVIYSDFVGSGIYVNGSDFCTVDNNIIENRGTGSYGISIFNSSVCDVKNNVVKDYNRGVTVSAGSFFNSIRTNKMSCSNEKGIYLDGNANLIIAPPTITELAYNRVSGTAIGGSTVDVFLVPEFCSSSSCDGFIYKGSVIADGLGNWTLSTSVSGCSKVVATNTDLFLNTSEFSDCYVNSYCVINTNDSGAGSLRNAIQAVNADPDNNQIQFKITGAAPFIISPNTALPALGSGISISGINSAGPVILDGQNLSNTENGLTITGNVTIVRDMNIRNFPGSGIYFSGGTQTCAVTDCTLTENGSYGISSDPNKSHNNLSIISNKIGLTSSEDNLGNGAAGIRLSNVINTEIEHNTIAYNTGNGIHLLSSANMEVRSNKIYCNAGAYGIYDSGGVFLGQEIDKPDITSFTDGVLSGTAEPGATLQIFALPINTCTEGCDPGGNEIIESSIIVPSNGKWSATIVMCKGFSISVTQSKDGHTSDFSDCQYINDLVVTNTESTGLGSFSWAVECANDYIGDDRIVFNIPGDGPHRVTIVNSSASFEFIETISDDYTVIDATTQPNYEPGAIIFKSYYFASYMLNVTGDYFEIYGARFEPTDGNSLNISGENFVIGSSAKGNEFIGTSTSYGFGISTNATNGLIEGNIFNGIEDGVKVNNSSSLIKISDNSFTCNYDAINNSPNFGGDDPYIEITDFTSFSASGNTYPGSTVELYAVDNTGCGDATCQGAQLIGTTTTVSSTWTISGDFSDVSTVTALSYFATNGNSDFADCLTKNSCLEVINTNDGGEGSLRAAIVCANNTPGRDEIYFNIDGVGPFVIDLLNPLPDLTDDETIIDATTQPNWEPGYVTIEGGAQHMPVGLHINADFCGVFGLRVFDFWSSGIFVDGTFCQIGELNKSNIVVANGSGITVANGFKVNIEYNFIGQEADESANANDWNGVLLTGNNDFSFVNNNTIANNGNYAINVGGAATKQVRMRYNSIFCNVDGGIRLYSTANNSVQAPTITSITPDSISGVGNNYIDFIELYEVDNSCVVSSCQGKVFISQTPADASGNWVIYGSFDAGKTFTALSTDDFGNTSEFSNCTSIEPYCLTVTNLNDSGPGSLREAINCAKSNPLFDVVTFDLDDLPSPYTIQLNSTLPGLTGEISIDATTQPGYYPGIITIDGSSMSSGQYGMTMTGDDNRIYGLQMVNFPTNAIRVYSGTTNSIIGTLGSGNYFCGSGSSAIQMYSSSNIVIEGNHFGVLADGTNCASTNSSAINGDVAGGEFSFNTITNHGYGISLGSAAQNVQMRSNKFYCNSNLGIKLTSSSNNGIDAPIITSANSSSITGTANPGDYIEIYYSDVSCPSSVCQGEETLGISIADPSGNWVFDGSFDPSKKVAATATDDADNTSAFSLCVDLQQLCESELDVYDNPILTGVYQASNLVTSESQIAVDADVTFKAGQKVILEPGFTTEGAQTFKVVIEACQE